MRIRNIALAAMVMLGSVLLLMPVAGAQTCDGTGNNFVDLNGDGFNDNAWDDDGDGIPNGLDADYVKHAQDGTGYQMRNGHGEHASADVMDNNMTQTRNHQRLRALNCEAFCNGLSSFGTTNGIGGAGHNGSGIGMSGDAVCDGTGPHGTRTRGGR